MLKVTGGRVRMKRGKTVGELKGEPTALWEKKRLKGHNLAERPNKHGAAGASSGDTVH